MFNSYNTVTGCSITGCNTKLLVSDIATFVLKGDVKLQLTN